MVCNRLKRTFWMAILTQAIGGTLALLGCQSSHSLIEGCWELCENSGILTDQRRYVFEKDGTFEYFTGGGQWLNPMKCFGGSYSVENDTLRLSVSSCTMEEVVSFQPQEPSLYGAFWKIHRGRGERIALRESSVCFPLEIAGDTIYIALAPYSKLNGKND